MGRENEKPYHIKGDSHNLRITRLGAPTHTHYISIYIDKTLQAHGTNGPDWWTRRVQPSRRDIGLNFYIKQRLFYRNGLCKIRRTLHEQHRQVYNFKAMS